MLTQLCNEHSLVLPAVYTGVKLGLPH
jgi:hypothetical protein